MALKDTIPVGGGAYFRVFGDFNGNGQDIDDDYVELSQIDPDTGNDYRYRMQNKNGQFSEYVACPYYSDRSYTRLYSFFPTLEIDIKGLLCY